MLSDLFYFYFYFFFGDVLCLKLFPSCLPPLSCRFLNLENVLISFWDLDSLSSGWELFFSSSEKSKMLMCMQDFNTAAAYHCDVCVCVCVFACLCLREMLHFTSPTNYSPLIDHWLVIGHVCTACSLNQWALKPSTEHFSSSAGVLSSTQDT